MSQKKICVVGAGRWGKNHVKTLANIGVLSGLVDTNEDTLKKFKNEYKDLNTFTSLDDAMAHGFDGFTVATPAETHVAVARKLILHGCPLLVEKPLALNSTDAKMLKQLAEKHNVPLMVGHVLLFHPAIKKMKELIDSGKIGKLEYLYTNRLNLGTVRTEENILWSFAPHDISIFQFFIDEYPVRVESSGGAFVQPHIHDTTMTTLNYPNNVVGHIFVSWLHPFKEHRIVVIGSKGMLSFEDSSEQKEVFFYEKGIDWVEGEPIPREGPTETISYERSMPLTEELSYFIEHLEKEPSVANAKNGVEVLEILEKASESLYESERASNLTESNAGNKNANNDYFVHESAFVDKNVGIGKGTKVWHFSHIQSNSKIGENCSLGQNVNVANNVIIGNNVKVQNNVSIYQGVELEDYVFCGPSMVFTNVNNPRSEFPQRGGEFYDKTLVKRGSSIGANATIVCGTTLGKYSFIAAGAVVTKDVPDYALMVGVPAKQSGWICRCGTQLSLKNGKSKCTNCSRTYRLENSQLVCVKEEPVNLQAKEA